MALSENISAFQTGAVSMSNRQYCMLRTIDRAARSIVHLEELSSWNQVTVRGLKRRGFINETKDKQGITVTSDGRRSLKSYLTAELYRKVQSLHFAGCLNLVPPAHLLKAFERRPAKEPKGSARATTAQRSATAHPKALRHAA